MAFGGSSIPLGIDLSQVLALPNACRLHVSPEFIGDFAPVNGALGQWDLLLPGIPPGVNNLCVQGFMVGLGAYPGALYLSATPAFRIL